MNVYAHASLRALTAPLFVRSEKTRTLSHSRSGEILADSPGVDRCQQRYSAGRVSIFYRTAGNRFSARAFNCETTACHDAARGLCRLECLRRLPSRGV